MGQHVPRPKEKVVEEKEGGGKGEWSVRPRETDGEEAGVRRKIAFKEGKESRDGDDTDDGGDG